MKTLLWPALMALLVFGTQAQAQPMFGPHQGMPYGAGYPASRPAPQRQPSELLNEGMNKLLGALSAGKARDPRIIRNYIDREIAPYFDFAYMAKWAAGPLYRRLDDAQRGQLEGALKGMFFSAMVRNLGTYGDAAPQVKLLPARPGHYPNEMKVPAQVWSPTTRTPVRIDFRFYLSPNGWKVFDVIANGTSALTYYRRYFNRLYRQSGRGFLSSPRY